MANYVEAVRAQDGGTILRLTGHWDVADFLLIEREIKAALHGAPFERAHVDATALQAIDTAGAMLLERMRRRATRSESGAEVSGLKHEYQEMLTLVRKTERACPSRPPRPGLIVGLLTRLGKATIEAWQSTLELLRFIGETSDVLIGSILSPRRFRFTSIVRHIDETGVDAIPVVALIAFLISVVLAYQAAAELRNFGAEIFTINMVALSVLREMGVLLTTIIVAGRSGSAFAAEIGVMKVNEEVDAMRVIGMDPYEVLVLPRLLALAITLPMLTLMADLMGLLGGGMICYLQLHISPEQYIHHFRGAVVMSDFWVGIIKAPVFAFLIATVGCMRGMEVEGSAESVGRLTTVAVVHSIFLVLLADAVFAITFTKLGI